MITLHGAGICKGVAMAQALIVQDGFDLADVPPTLLQQGLDALRRGYPENEFPSIVLMCYSLAHAQDIKLPGIQITAIAAETAVDVDIETLPCVAEVDNLLRNVSNGDIVIVDGNLGTIHVDPDAAILAHYQGEGEKPRERRVFLGSSHLPAVTQDGRTIAVLGVVSAREEEHALLSEGADGLVLKDETARSLSDDDWLNLMNLLGGEPLILLSCPKEDVLRSLLSLALPLQVTLAVSEQELACVASRIASIRAELEHDHVGTVEIALATPADADAGAYLMAPGSQLAIVGASIDRIPSLPREVHSIAVAPGMVSAAKDLIRSIPAQE